MHLQGDIILFGGDYYWVVELWMSLELTFCSDQPLGASYYLQQNFTAKILIPKYGGSLILASLTNIIHQVDLRIHIGLCFISCL